MGVLSITLSALRECKNQSSSWNSFKITTLREIWTTSAFCEILKTTLAVFSIHASWYIVVHRTRSFFKATSFGKLLNDFREKTCLPLDATYDHNIFFSYQGIRTKILLFHCHNEKIEIKTFRVLWHVISIQTNLICRHVPPISSKLSSDNKIWASRIFPSTEKSHNLAIRTPQIRPQVLSYAKDRQWAGSSETVGTSLTIWNINLQRLLWFYFIIFLSRCW